jgi:DNA-binding NtrC family response regulator/predicted hydrocarbon binding protein
MPFARASSPSPTFDDLIARLRHAPETGHIWLDEQRVFMLHSTAYGALRRELIENLGAEIARGLLTRMGHLAGSRDAELAKKIRRESDVVDVFSIGPQLHALEGIVRTVPITVEVDIAKGYFFGDFIWHDSVEDQAHLVDYNIGPEPVCWMQVGYASGYTSAFMGSPILFREIECRSMGNEQCRVVGKPVRDWQDAQEDLRFFNAQPFANRRIVSIPGTSGVSRKSDTESKALRSRYDQRRLIGISPAFNATCHMINRVARTTTPVLLLGESGVGKEMFARILHETSDNASGAFVAVNCAAIPDTLIEADLFGVEKGAFTGASSSKPGRFERADGGTLLLDEIGCLSLAAQSKLLRVLQEGTFERIGDDRMRTSHVRIVAATNEDLALAVKLGKFREDLFYRLDVFPITVPPLRDRKEDIPILADYFLRNFCDLHQKLVTGFSEEALDALISYQWPGNVRQLENVIERATLLSSEGGAIELTSLPTAIASHRNVANPDFRQSEAGLVDGVPGQARTLNPFEENEYVLLKNAIEISRGNLSAVARDLGISRAQVSYRVKKMGLSELCRSRS